MAWIESHQSLLRHPKVSRFARILGISKAEAIGRLHMLWWWSLDFAQDGDLSRYDPDDIAETSDWSGDPNLFVTALIQSGFCDDNPLRIHDWNDYAGRLMERREKNAERQRISRKNIGVRFEQSTQARDVRVTSQVRHIATVPNRTVPNSTVPNSTKTKKNMRDSFEGAQSLTGNDAEGLQVPDIPAERPNEYPSDFLEFWESYPRRMDKRRTYRVWKTRLKEQYAPNDMIQAAMNYASYCSERHTEPGFIKHPSTFLGPDKPFEEFIDGYAVIPTKTNHGANAVKDVLELARQNMFGGGESFDI